MERREFRRRQLVGLLAGLIGGAVAGGYWPQLRGALGWYGVTLWGGVIGGVIASLPKFGVVGQRLTRSSNPLVNFVAGAALLAGVVFVLLTAAGLLLHD